jgi:hypothetical protein
MHVEKVMARMQDRHKHPDDMTANIIASEPGSPSKMRLNIAVAGLLAALSLWMTVADFSHQGDLLFQTSASGMVMALFVSLLFLASLVLAALPKRMVIGTSLLLLCRLSLGFPLNLWIGNTAASRVASVLLLVFALVYLTMTLGRLMRMENRPWVQLRHSLVAFGAWVSIGIISIPVWMLGYAYGAQFLIGDYAKLSPGGVSLVERVFEKDGRKVHLVGMMHVGDGAFYRDLKQRMAATPASGGKRLVLTEGVADRENLIPADFANGKTYGRWAKAFGIEVQPQLGSNAPREPSASEVPLPVDRAAEVDFRADPNVIFRNADIDIADLDGNHKRLLVRLLEAASSDGLSVRLGSGLGDVTGTQIEDLLKNGLILARNNVLMKQFENDVSGFSEIYIPWGAAHLPDIEKRLLSGGYLKISDVTRPIVTFWK